jgi:hypothetical protein
MVDQLLLKPLPYFNLSVGLESSEEGPRLFLGGQAVLADQVPADEDEPAIIFA